MLQNLLRTKLHIFPVKLQWKCSKNCKLFFHWICGRNSMPKIQQIRVWIFWKIKPLGPSDFPFTRETDTQKSWAVSKNFNYFIIKLTETLILPNYQVQNVFFYNYKFNHWSMKVLQNCFAVICVSVSENLR